MKWIAVLLMCAGSAFGVTIAREGKSDYVIVLAKDAPAANQRAAKELQSYLKQMCGAELAIVDDAQRPPPHSIDVGPNRFVEMDNVFGDDGFVIHTTGEEIIIAGGGKRGTMYGVSEFLEKLGVRWYTPKVTVVPKKATIEIDVPWEKQIPAFEYREPYFTEAWNKDWAAHNKLIGHSLPLDASTGGNIRYGDFVHSFDRLIPPGLFEKHPEYFPEIGGKRTNGYVQRCLSNPEVLKIAVEGVKNVFKNDPTAVITTVSQNDTDKWCDCAKCKELVAKYGGVQSGIYLWFVNQVAAAIEKEYPDKLIDTLAYQFTQAPPKNISPRKNVRVRLCPISNCQAHPYESDDFPASKAFVANLANWRTIAGDNLYIWHYVTNFPHYLMPLPDFAEFTADTKLYARSGVKGVFFQGAYCGPGGADAELKSWVMSRILWNPDADADAAVTEWMQGVYGKAWKPMRAWHDELQTAAKDPAFHPVCYSHDIKRLFTEERLAKAQAWFEEAEKLAEGDALATEYVGKSRLWLRYVRIIKNVGGEDLGKFVADCKKFGITHTSESQGIDEWAKARGGK